MMTDHRDPLLQTFFAEARQDLEGEALTARVMAKTQSLRFLLLAAGISAAVLLLTGTWLIFGLPLLEFAVLVSEALTATLFDLGSGWLALVFLPVNNIASLLVVTAKTIHYTRKKLAAFKI